jgi:uncharacterized protein (TIGR02453 family)
VSAICARRLPVEASAGGSAVASEQYFSRDSFDFLKELRSNNKRDWFQKNKERYEAKVRNPFLRFIADLGPRLRTINPHIVVDPSPTGGSTMRIYRDIRFSKDKSPYKTAIAAHFWHEKGKEGAIPAYYLHVEPGGSLIGAGIWRPEPGALKKIRDAIARDSKRWKRVTSAGELGYCKMSGESLQRPPRGYDPNHPLIDDIKRKDFTLGRSLTDQEVLRTDFLGTALGTFRKTAPFVQFLSQAVGLR